MNEVTEIKKESSRDSGSIDSRLFVAALLQKLISLEDPSSPEWCRQGRVSSLGVYRLVREFDFDPSRLMLVPDYSSWSEADPHYCVYLNAGQFEEQGKILSLPVENQ